MAGPNKPARVLVIDDDDIARELLVSTLERGGHTVFEAPSALGASRLISQNKIDVVVIDVMLPDIDGDKLARVLRSNPHGEHLGIVLVSSCPVGELEALAAKAGADAIVPKTEIRMRLGPTVSSAYRSRSGAPPAR